MAESISKLDREPTRSHIINMLKQGLSNPEIARLFETSEKSIRRFRQRHGFVVSFQSPSCNLDKDELDISLPSHKGPPKLDNPDEMLRERGLSGDDWEISQISLNEWTMPEAEGGMATYHQAKLHLKKKRLGLMPARTDGWKAPVPITIDSTKPRLVVALSDQHAPHHDPDLHSCVVAWLKANKPDEGLILGDLLNLSEISRHRHSPAWSARTQECIDIGYQIILDYVQASPLTRWKFINGNHEAHLRNSLIDYVSDLFGVKRAKDADNVLSVPHLLRFDELNIEYIGDEADTYDHAKIKLSKYLGAIHGYNATKGSGSTALKSLEKYGHSILQGHSHRQALVHMTTWDIDGNPETLLGAEIGCLCQIKGGLGYDLLSNWQQGFASARVYPDGRFKVELATYVQGSLFYGDERYES